VVCKTQHVVSVELHPGFSGYALNEAFYLFLKGRWLVRDMIRTDIVMNIHSQVPKSLVFLFITGSFATVKAIHIPSS